MSSLQSSGEEEEKEEKEGEGGGGGGEEEEEGSLIPMGHRGGRNPFPLSYGT